MELVPEHLSTHAMQLEKQSTPAVPNDATTWLNMLLSTALDQA